MRIGFFTETFLPQRDGVVTSIESFGERLVERGHEVHVFAPQRDRAEHLGMSIHKIPSVKFPGYEGYRIALPMNQMKKMPALDIVHTHGPFSMGLFGLHVSKQMGIPRVTTFHTMITDYLDYLPRSLKPILLSRTMEPKMKRMIWKYFANHYSKYDEVIVPSKAIRNVLPKKVSDSVPVKIIPTGIDTSELKPVPNAKKRMGWGKKTFIYLGRVSYEKKIDVLINAMKNIDADLIIAGKGPALESLKKQAAGMHNVRFAGFVPEKDKALYYSAADAFVSASDSETQGIVVTEAHACGCPAIVADALAFPEMIAPGAGVLFRPGNSKQLAKIMNSFKSTSGMRRKAREFSLRFDIEKTTDRLEEVYESLV